jgi:hypothetical protein
MHYPAFRKDHSGIYQVIAPDERIDLQAAATMVVSTSGSVFRCANICSLYRSPRHSLSGPQGRRSRSTRSRSRRARPSRGPASPCTVTTWSPTSPTALLRRHSERRPAVLGGVDGRLYLNLDRDIQAKWLEDVPANIAEVEANWTEIRSVAVADL